MENIFMHTKIISGMCRLCLSSNGTLIDMFSFSSELDSQIAEAVTKCTSVHVEKHSKLPTTICESCYTQLVKTQNFQTQALKSDKTLQLYLHRLHDDDTQSILQSSTILPNVGSSCIEINVAKQNKEDNGTHYVEIKPEVKYFESDCEDFEIDNVDSKDLPLESKSHKEWDANNSSKVLDFNPKLTVKAEPLNDEEDQFDVDTEIPNDLALTSRIIKEETEVTRDNMIASYQCDVCNKSFSELDHLTNHKHIHNSEKPHQCDVCNKSFKQLYLLKTHQRIHTGERPYQCDVCNKRFTILDHLRRHQRIHTGEKPYQCDKCTKCFTLSSHLQDHKRTHTGEKPYRCDVCDKRFSKLNNMKTHQRVHSGEKPYQCDVCNNCFGSLANLKRHERVHSGEKPFQCDVCNKSFSKIDNLKSHQRVHSGEKPYRCDVCNKCFGSSANLKRHLRVHSGEKPYQCGVCNRLFSNSDNLKRHQRGHTGEMPYQDDL